MKHNILGLDPGSVKMGYALIQMEGKTSRILDSGVVKFKSSQPFFERLGGLKNFIDELIEKHGSDFQVAAESLIHVKNVSSLAKLSQARGVILGTLSSHGCSIYEYSPNLIKSSVSGYGHASKESVEKALHFLFPKHQFAADDESDALAVAICHSLYKGEVSGKHKGKRASGSLKASFKHLNK